MKGRRYPSGVLGLSSSRKPAGRGPKLSADPGGEVRVRPPASPTRAHPDIDEDTLHIHVARFLALALPPEVLWWHTPNGGKREKRMGRGGKMYSPEGAKLKRMGAKAGVPDLTFGLPGDGPPRLHFIELKDEDGRLSVGQVTWKSRCEQANAPWALCRSVPEVYEALKGWGFPLRARPAA